MINISEAFLEQAMANKKLWLVMAVAFGMIAIGCGGLFTPNPFSGTSWGPGEDGSSIEFYSSTWMMHNYLHNTEGGGKDLYDFRGTYTYRGNTATLTATDYRSLGDSRWYSWSGRWTATITGGWLTMNGPYAPRVLLNLPMEAKTYTSADGSIGP